MSKMLSKPIKTSLVAEAAQAHQLALAAWVQQPLCKP